MTHLYRTEDGGTVELNHAPISPDNLPDYGEPTDRDHEIQLAEMVRWRLHISVDEIHIAHANRQARLVAWCLDKIEEGRIEIHNPGSAPEIVECPPGTELLRKGWAKHTIKEMDFCKFISTEATLIVRTPE